MQFDLEKTTEFIFHNWNVILEKEYDATNTLTDGEVANPDQWFIIKHLQIQNHERY